MDKIHLTNTFYVKDYSFYLLSFVGMVFFE